MQPAVQITIRPVAGQQGPPLQVIVLNAASKLYRHNSAGAAVRMTMDQIYNAGAEGRVGRPAYFLINNAAKLPIYEGHYSTGSSGKEFSIIPGQQVRLLNMGDRATVDFIKSEAAAAAAAEGGAGAAAAVLNCADVVQALEESFPLTAGVQRRVSTGEHKACDDTSIREICRVIREIINPMYGTTIDGYYSHPQVNSNGDPSFHAEVGLCPTAFRKFYVSAKIDRTAPPRHNRNGGHNGAGAPGGQSRTLSRIPLNGAPGGGGGLLGMFQGAASPDEGGGGGGGGLLSMFAAASPGGGKSAAKKLGFGGGRRRTRRRSNYRRGARRSRSGNGAN